MSSLQVRRHNRILEITIDRPKANAIDTATSRALGAVFSEYRDDPQLRAAIITGAGERMFCAGYDIKAGVASGELEGADFGPGGFAGLEILLDLNKPVIAAVNGAAVGGGTEICLACHIVVFAEHATVSLPEAMLGVVAGAGGVQRMPRRVPRNVALEMLYTGRRMGAAEAARWGFANAVVPHAQLMDKAREIATTIAARAPLAIQAITEMTRETESLSDREAYLSIHTPSRFPSYAQVLSSTDHEEGLRAFVEKRDPVWSGR
jgi:crotonobetainyl-CoA hydratase